MLAMLSSGEQKYIPLDEWIVACSGESAVEMRLRGGDVLTAIGAALWGLTDDTRPTCPACAVLLDAALEGAGVTSGPSRP